MQLNAVTWTRMRVCIGVQDGADWPGGGRGGAKPVTK